jgi:hypothetical protein
MPMYPKRTLADRLSAAWRRGYSLGKNLVFESRGAGGRVYRLKGLAQELIAAKVALIVTTGYGRSTKERPRCGAFSRYTRQLPPRADWLAVQPVCTNYSPANSLLTGKIAGNLAQRRRTERRESPRCRRFSRCCCATTPLPNREFSIPKQGIFGAEQGIPLSGCGQLDGTVTVARPYWTSPPSSSAALASSFALSSVSHDDPPSIRACCPPSRRPVVGGC